MALSEADKMRLGLSPSDQVLSSTPRFGMDVQLFPSLSGLPSADSLKADALSGIGLAPSTSPQPAINVTGGNNAGFSGPQPQRRAGPLSDLNTLQKIGILLGNFGAGYQGRPLPSDILIEQRQKQEALDLERVIQFQGLIQKDIDRLGDLPIAQREEFIAQRSAFYNEHNFDASAFLSQPDLTATPLWEIPEFQQIGSQFGAKAMAKFAQTKEGQEAMAAHNFQKLAPTVQTKLEALTDFIRENEPATLENGLRYAEIAARNNELPESIRFTQAELGVLNRNQTQFSELIEPDEVAIAKAKKGQASSGTIITLFSPDGKRRRGFRAGDPRVDSLLDAGWTREPITEASAGALIAGPPSKKEIEDLRSLEIQGRNIVSEISDLRPLIRGNAAALSQSGGLANFANNVRVGVIGMSQILGTEFEVGGQDSTAGDLLAAASDAASEVLTDDVLKRTQIAASDRAAFRSSITNLAYALAILSDPSGRVSDNDVKIKIQELGAQLSGSDPEVVERVLNDVERRAIRMFETTYKVRARGVPEAPAVPDIRSERRAESPAAPAASGGVQPYRKGAGPGVYTNEAGETIIVTPDGRILKDTP